MSWRSLLCDLLIVKYDQFQCVFTLYSLKDMRTDRHGNAKIHTAKWFELKGNYASSDQAILIDFNMISSTFISYLMISHKQIAHFSIETDL